MTNAVMKGQFREIVLKNQTRLLALKFISELRHERKRLENQ